MLNQRLLSVLLGLIVCGAALAQAKARVRPLRPEDRQSDRALAAVIARSPQVYGDRLNVKLREGSGAELVDGRLRSRTGTDLRSVEALFARASAAPLFTAASWDELDVWHRRACAALPDGRGPGHLGLWFRLTTPTIELADHLSEQLWELDLVEHVVKEVRGAPAGLSPIARSAANDIPPPTPSFTSMQLRFQPSPLGHSTWRSQGVFGARGQGLGMLMVESEWYFDHEDVSKIIPASFIGPVPGTSSPEAHHGVAGASQIVADRNEYGITGMADEVGIQFVSHITNGGHANALLTAGVNAQQGDVVMMILMFLLAQTGSTDWVPFELLQPIFDATLTLTGNGMIVVVAAGNGDNSLDDPRFYNRFDLSYRDSGAMMVSSSLGGPLGKAAFANFGSRVDANSWGDSVVACGYGTLFFPNNDLRQAYTAAGTGTSSATAALGGIVVSIQGAAERQLEQRLTYLEIRQLLRSHGPQSPHAIGRRPDLYEILETLGAVDGLELSHPDVALGGAETVTVTGAPGSAGFLFASFGTGSLDLGFNRKIHLSLPSMLTLGFVPMPTGMAGFQISVPNSPGLRGLSLYLQAGVLQGSAPVHVTNSCQLSIY